MKTDKVVGRQVPSPATVEALWGWARVGPAPAMRSLLGLRPSMG